MPIFRKLYHYEVREIPLTLEALHREGLEWPWHDPLSIDEKDLQKYRGLSEVHSASAQHFHLRFAVQRQPEREGISWCQILHKMKHLLLFIRSLPTPKNLFP